MKKENTDVTGEDPQEIIANVKDKMSKTVENTREALGAIRTGRPSPKMFDKVMVSAYDAETPLPQLATVSIQSASSVMISPFDPSTLGDIEKGILKSELNLTPSNDGATIRINIPPLTTETRAQFAKQANSVAEDGKVALRNIRRTGVDAIRKLEKGSSPISEDESKALQDQVQKLTDKCSTELSDLAKAKEKELNTV
ncbi:MAG: ribosome recycling factor [Promethearchaeia archaeon]